MDARWTWVIDNPMLRATINTVALALWIAASLGILEFAARY